MNAFVTHVAYEFKSGVRNTSQLFMYYLFPLGVYLILGLVMAQINPVFAGTAMPAMVLLAGMATFLLGLPGPLVEARQAGVFRNYRINGVPAASILFVPVLTTLLHFLIVATVITVTCGTLFHAVTPSSWLGYGLCTLLAACVYGSLGAFISVVASNSRVVMMLSQFIFLPSMLIGGMMVPLAMLPPSIRAVARILPTTHLMQVYGAFAFGTSTAEAPSPLAAIPTGTLSLAVLAVGTVVALALAIGLYRWDAREKSRRDVLVAFAAFVPYIASAVFA